MQKFALLASAIYCAVVIVVVTAVIYYTAKLDNKGILGGSIAGLVLFLGFSTYIFMYFVPKKVFTDAHDEQLIISQLGVENEMSPPKLSISINK